jgi:hypothetical protein
MRVFVAEVKGVIDDELIEPVELVTKLCCKHFGELGKHKCFKDMMDECPQFSRAVLITLSARGCWDINEPRV